MTGSIWADPHISSLGIKPVSASLDLEASSVFVRYIDVLVVSCRLCSKDSSAKGDPTWGSTLLLTFGC